MKKFPKLLQCDRRGQIVIPKDVRSELRIEEGTGFWLYAIEGEGLLLKKVDVPALDDHRHVLSRIDEKKDLIGVSKKNIDKAVQKYKKTKEGNLEVV
jgi:AbrB family looped-hinge helix DNA binding protein